MQFKNIGRIRGLTVFNGVSMCFSNCPYENYWGECKISHRPYPANARCTDPDELEPLEDEEYEDEDDLLC